ncbi:MAG: hypothetical protein QM496_22420 [Verrucomicrobiota bacterium]
MGLFDFLKPKKKPLSDFADNPAIRNVMAGMELEYLQKQVGNLDAVGRPEDAKKAVHDFMERYSRDSSGKECSPQELAQICYTASYMYLPELVFESWSNFEDLWSSSLPFSVFLAVTVATRMEKRLSADQILQFKSKQGNIGDDIDCFLIEYPAPPPQENDLDMDALIANIGAGAVPPVLGPYYAVISHRQQTEERWLHILGQSPGSGTTIRAVSGSGAHGNCGPGPDPSSPTDFLRAIQQFVT